MSETYFPFADLFRRGSHTGLVIATIALSLCSTVSLLLFASRVGIGIFTREGVLTSGLTLVFSQFLTFVGILIFVVGAVVAAFIAFLVMAQRTKDIGLMRAAGCPSSLVAGYFVTELILVDVAGCVLGVLAGIMIDYGVSLSGSGGGSLGVPQYWHIAAVLIAFFSLVLGFGMRPVLSASKMETIRALSPVQYFGLSEPNKFSALSGHGLTWKIAYRSLLRRQSATVRILCVLSAVFILVTVIVAGGITASETTLSWIENSLAEDTILIAHGEMISQYSLLMSRFSSEIDEPNDFDYWDKDFTVSNELIQTLRGISDVSCIDARIIFMDHINEVSNFTIDPETLETFPVGDHRETDALIVGIEPGCITTGIVQGRVINEGSVSEAVIGDSVGHAIFSPNPAKGIVFSNPLVQGVKLQSQTFEIVGVCVDPINNGYVVYVPIKGLLNTTHIVHSNIVLISVGQSGYTSTKINEIRSKVREINPDFDAVEIAKVAEKNCAFLRSIWSTIMLLPVFTLASVALCLVGYMTIAIDEQKREYAVMRAVGGKPRLVVGILTLQSLVVLFSGFGIGISLGMVTTLIVLMANPLVTSGMIIVIAAWLLSALAAMLGVTLLPIFRIARSPILKHLA